MIFADKSNFEQHGSQIGIAEISTFSSIRALAKMGIPLEGMVALNVLIKEVECVLWSIVPMCLEKKHGTEYKNQCEHLKKLIDNFIVASIAMAEMMRNVP
jgi:hypothetical protein